MELYTMKLKLKKITSVLVGAMLVMPGTLFAESYIVMTKNNQVDQKTIASIEAMGAKVTNQLPQVGMLVVESDDLAIRENLANIAGVQSTLADINLQYITPSELVPHTIKFEEMAASPPNTGDDDFLFDLQWGHDAVNATEAWEAGITGEGVRVAVLDSGISSSHADIVPNLNTSLSTSFITGEDYDNPPGSHGTHTAGTIAAANNAYGTIGVAPDAEIVSVKVLSALSGSGPFSSIFAGMIYAADIDADVINMSLGATIPRNCTFGTEHFPAKDCAELFVALNRVTHYVNSQGTLIVASAGNSARDLNHDASIKSFPAEGTFVVSVSALAPYLWADDSTTDLDVLASYSNYGKNGIDLGAPGGDFDVFFDIGATTCNGPVVPGRPCYVYDMVLSTVPGGWSWNAGTSMAAPHVSGVAALIISENGGKMSPVALRQELSKRADDIYKPGQDDESGTGRVSSGY